MSANREPKTPGTPRAVQLEPGFDSFRRIAVRLLAEETRPEQIVWTRRGEATLFDAGAQHVNDRDPEFAVKTPRVPRAFHALCRRIMHHRSIERAHVAYRVLYRLTHGEPHLLEVATDRDIVRLTRLDAQVRRSAHKTKAFVRFREVRDDNGARFVAWHVPEHPILPLVADFFAERFSDMRWSILTPDASLHFDGERHSLGPGLPQSAAPRDDSMESLWRTYYRSIFNPARVMVKAMQAEMPKRHWATMPETAEIPSLLAEAPQRVKAMLAASNSAPTAEAMIDADDAWDELRDKSRGCAACPLYASATQTVFGRGPLSAKLVLIGEQPGDEEDLAGEPFIGPAGRLLDMILERVELTREEVYVTNAVKHFRFTPRGKKRLHQRPSTQHLRACRPWLIAELERLQAKVIVCLGLSAARSLLGVEIRLESARGEIAPSPWGSAIVTYHPSALLRASDEDERARLERALESDLRWARDLLA